MTSYFVRLKRRSQLPEEKRDTEAIFADADGTLKQMGPDGTVSDLGGGEPGGSQPGAVRMVGPYTVGFGDVVLNADTNGYALIGEIAEGVNVVGVAWRVTTAFTGSSGGLVAAGVLPGNGTDTFGSTLQDGPIDLTSPANTDALGGVYGVQDVGAPALYRTASGTNPRNASLEAYGVGLPWQSAGEDLYLVVGGWAGDSDAGTVEFFFYVATPMAS